MEKREGRTLEKRMGLDKNLAFSLKAKQVIERFRRCFWKRSPWLQGDQLGSNCYGSNKRWGLGLNLWVWIWAQVDGFEKPLETMRNISLVMNCTVMRKGKISRVNLMFLTCITS